MKTIAVYGSSMAKPGEPDYADTIAVGHAIAEAGYAVISGGYAGLMAAASEGAASVDGKVIGVTTAALKKLRGAQPNQWLTDEIHYPTMQERLMHLILEPDGHVVMPGGIGTLTELIMVWELIRSGDLPSRPLILYGDYWVDLLAPMRQLPYFNAESWGLLQTATTPADVIQLLRAHWES